jgi:hypothetical protein
MVASATLSHRQHLTSLGPPIMVASATLSHREFSTSLGPPLMRELGYAQPPATPDFAWATDYGGFGYAQPRGIFDFAWATAYEGARLRSATGNT